MSHAGRAEWVVVWRDERGIGNGPELPTRKAYIVETQLLGPVLITLLVNCRALLAVQQRLRRTSNETLEKRLAALLAVAAAVTS